ncbi:MAG: NADH-quinone oxidoreductase subunit C [Armatimonadota bacterium]|nr:NADH-quinone oxidoreductase subunit C [Armatimonadota bacterium]MDR7451384.1 NADH-quinone oxidoreductase subunit C [Armatimonadota bacterium]MDR7466466.1 NADH-quinone oxidoreductase subunit C [Armatimonadota bacterium]MDR7493188.1 NADH-quinone oxidoreductase subunit C [Armatimonadota bacterium]MDR7499459.1 NADH-quinone oxidoreductase subunit C [Armatimonadota bacterium]
MSWELAEKLRARFPDLELFPRPGAAEHHGEPAGPAPPAPSAGPEGGASPGGAPARPAPRRPAHEAPPAFLTPGVFVPRERLLEVCRALAGDPEFGLSYLSFVSAIDRPAAGQLEVLYHLYSHRTKEELALKVRVDRAHPVVPSVTSIWDGANWHEREAYDLFGIVFEGHPNLRRIMMTDDWVGHPLRKDYVYQDPPWLVEAAKQRQKDLEGLGLGERA